jgi:hypothetical protein
MTVQAENLTITPYKGRPDQAEVRFDFKCPNCETVHHKREITRQPFHTIGYALHCGDVQVNLNKEPQMSNPTREERLALIEAAIREPKPGQ